MGLMLHNIIVHGFFMFFTMAQLITFIFCIMVAKTLGVPTLHPCWSQWWKSSPR